jgi:hypothetical protein
MAAVTKNERKPKVDARPGQPSVEVMDEIVEVELRPEVLRRAIAAAQASGQTTNEWICAAVAEAIERRSKAVTKPNFLGAGKKTTRSDLERVKMSQNSGQNFIDSQT